MDFELQWLLMGLPVAFALGWLASRLDLRQWKHEVESSPRAYFKGLNLLLNEQQDKAIDAFIEAVQHDPGSSDLHFALGNLFRRRGDYERAVRVHQHVLGRADLPVAERDRAQHALAQDYLKAGLFDRAEAAYQQLEGTAFATDARLALLTLYERSRDWRQALEVARGLEAVAAGSFAGRISHYWCEIALEAEAQGQLDDAQSALQRAREAAPQAARPLVLLGQRQLRREQPAEAMATWALLATIHPDAFSVVAADYAAAATACGAQAVAMELLQGLLKQSPSSDVLAAWLKLAPEHAQRREALLQALQHQASLSPALALLQDTPQVADEAAQQAIVRSMTAALKPLRRYRCAACGFEAHHYFWQCPGCQGWDTYPPRRLEDQ
ncbi:lipopolysaccharide biosynthesis regulator YciM [Sphaerotilus hippei]|uniref:Lipopolysaccharide assembly protein B n=1 Tax=Sphaerotilus hippei TaxID=744406 RepID=A0A318H2J9_9BURK|nr:lipopolysaccharide assembly protein LapB [Sphaerotilus hippei]PXW92261.1 lipopolysaccharide biosynthesis regulator YciM [Sphaerotilus hippei]